MNPVYKKLQAARLELQRTAMTKSGKNKFAGYEYFELGDFIPAVQKIFGDMGLFGMVSYTHEMASLTIYDTEAEGSVVFTSPMSTAALKGCHEVQNLGAVESYLRRYLWVTALEIVEHDALDSTTGSNTEKPSSKPVDATPKPAETAIKPKMTGESGPWQMKVSFEPEGDPQEWMEAVSKACSTALGMSETIDDVMQIFKKNKRIFDAAKLQDPSGFKDLMTMFTETKTKLTKE
jgi:ERF superfamily